MRAHIARFFLHPHKFPRIRVTIHFRRNFRLGKWIQLLDENDRRSIFRMPLSFGDKLVPDFPGAEQHAFRGAVAHIRNHGLKAAAGQISKR